MVSKEMYSLILFANKKARNNQLLIYRINQMQGMGETVQTFGGVQTSKIIIANGF